MNKPLVELKGIEKVYGNGETVTRALAGIDLEIEEGEFVSIMGPSGSGKSTLMHILGFLDKPTRGSYHFSGKLIHFSDDDYLAALRNKTTGFIFQAFNLLPRTTVLDNVILPLLYSGEHSKEHMRERGLAVLDSVGMSHRIGHFSNQLSGGEKQRVAIARSLINDPKVIFADEPTGNLDSKSGSQIMEILQDLNEEGRTIILVTHESFAAEAAKRIVHIKDGSILSDSAVRKRRIAKKGEFLK